MVYYQNYLFFMINFYLEKNKLSKIWFIKNDDVSHVKKSDASSELITTCKYSFEHAD